MFFLTGDQQNIIFCAPALVSAVLSIHIASYYFFIFLQEYRNVQKMFAFNEPVLNKRQRGSL